MEKKNRFEYYDLEDIEEDAFENLSESIDDEEDMQEFNTRNFYNRQHYCGNRLVPRDKNCNCKGT